MFQFIKNLFKKNDTIYVGNLPYSIRNDDLKNYFSKIGEVTEYRIIKHHKSNRSKGYGFVKFSNHQDAKKALDLHNKSFKGRELQISLASK